MARVLSVDGSAIPSEKLYKLQLDVGGDETRQVVAGLKMFVPAGQLLDSLVVAILNLKPAKLAGVVSEVINRPCKGCSLLISRSTATAPLLEHLRNAHATSWLSRAVMQALQKSLLAAAQLTMMCAGHGACCRGAGRV